LKLGRRRSAGGHMRGQDLTIWWTMTSGTKAILEGPPLPYMA
jgi:hypothetical protein